MLNNNNRSTIRVVREDEQPGRRIPIHVATQTAVQGAQGLPDWVFHSGRSVADLQAADSQYRAITGLDLTTS